MLSRRRFKIATIASLALLYSCTYRKQITGLTGDIAQDATTLAESGITMVTTGYVGWAALTLFLKSFDDEKIAAPPEQELIEHARLVRRNVKELLAEQFEIVDSVAYEDQLLAHSNTAFINWQKLATGIKNLEDMNDNVAARRILLIAPVMFGKDYQYVTRI